MLPSRTMTQAELARLLMQQQQQQQQKEAMVNAQLMNSLVSQSQTPNAFFDPALAFTAMKGIASSSNES